jgi:hypothetical protein
VANPKLPTGNLHDDLHDPEEDVREPVQKIDEQLPMLAQRSRGDAEQYGEENDLQDVAFGERVDRTRGNDVHHDVDEAQLLSLLRVLGDVPFGQRGDTDARPRFEDIHNEQADGQSQCGDDLKVDESLGADFSNLPEVGHVGDAEYDGQKDDRADDHLDQADESIAERLHGPAGAGRDQAEDHAGSNGQQDLNGQIAMQFAHEPQPV